MFSRRTFLNTAFAAIASIPFLQAERALALVQPKRDYIEVSAIVNGKGYTVTGLDPKRRYFFTLDDDGLWANDRGPCEQDQGASFSFDFTKQALKKEPVTFGDIHAVRCRG